MDKIGLAVAGKTFSHTYDRNNAFHSSTLKMNFSRKFGWPFSTTKITALSTFCYNSTCWFPPLRAVSLEYQNVIRFSLLDYTTGSTLAAHFYPMRNTTKTTRVCFASDACIWFKFGLIHLNVYVLRIRDWSEWLFWLWFNDTKLKKKKLLYVPRTDTGTPS